MHITLRPATQQDYDFLWWLHCHTIRPYVEQLWGWDEAWQRQYFREHFRPEKTEIVEADGAPAGCLRVERRQDHIFLSLIQIAPQHQNQGVGTKLIESLIVEGDRHNMPVRLSVLQTNDLARRLYERLGFVVVQETDERIYMERRASTERGGGA